MGDRVILHCDLDNFFASVECTFRPELRDVPMAVCGSESDRHGIVLAKNQLAKKAGVKTAQTVWQARSICPQLVCVPPHMDKYREFSVLARQIYLRYTDLVEPFSIDECWLRRYAKRTRDNSLDRRQLLQIFFKAFKRYQ